MKRNIIKIDEDKCTGCGLCVTGCAEGALKIIDGKAKLVSEVYCDGLGACIGECPEGALTIEEREAEAFDEKAVEAKLAQNTAGKTEEKPVFQCCPGSAMRTLNDTEEESAGDYDGDDRPSKLRTWPVQLKLVPPQAPFFKNADILVCADCVPFAVADFHERYISGRAVVVGCPKLDDLEKYRSKLAAIFAEAQPKSITVLRMEVPCCAGIAGAVVEARDKTMPNMPVAMHTISINGDISRQNV